MTLYTEKKIYTKRHTVKKQVDKQIDETKSERDNMRSLATKHTVEIVLK